MDVFLRLSLVIAVLIIMFLGELTLVAFWMERKKMKDGKK